MGILFLGEETGERPLPERPIRVLGIDLGTTNSVATDIVWDPAAAAEPSVSIVEVPQLLIDGGSIIRELLPSVVALVDATELIGEGAHRLRARLGQMGLHRDRDIWWEQKNWMGTTKSHPHAPSGFRTPKEIATKILRHLHESALDALDMPIDRIVVTVPASFQLTQRKDTLEAAIAADLDLREGDLLDEPIAAFLDYASIVGIDQITTGERTRVMVVDFGGGTCDVALLAVSHEEKALRVARRNVSRFHRIGGGDLDLAIATEVLLPRLLAEHGIGRFVFDFRHKQNRILPALTATAEALKKKLSDEHRRLANLGQLPKKPGDLRVELPTSAEIDTGHNDYGVLQLPRPSLSLEELNGAVDGFLSRSVTPPIGREYYTVTSIFAPIDDALRRAEWKAESVDAILVVGGSGMDPSVQAALKKAFSGAKLLTYADPLDAQRSISRGAAIHALHREAFDRAPIQPTLAEDLAILTEEGLDVIVPAGTPLPHPPDGGAEIFDDLAVPDYSDDDPYPLILEFHSGEQRLYSEVVALQPPVQKGDPIHLEVSISADQVMQMRLTVNPGSAEQIHAVTLDNPFAVTANPNADRERIIELTEVARAPDADAVEVIVEIAGLHEGLAEYERARQLLEDLLPRSSGGRTSDLLFRLANICARMGDLDGQIAHLKRALELGRRWNASFDLALALWRADRDGEALTFADMAVAARDTPPTRTLRGMILEALGRGDEANKEFQQVAKSVERSLDSMDEWDLLWNRNATHSLGRDDLTKRIDAALKRLRERNPKDNQVESVENGLPPIRAAGGRD